MCAAARARFSGKRKLIDWARMERSQRVELMLMMAEPGDFPDSDSVFYKRKSVLFRLQEYEREFKDVFLLMVADKKPLTIAQYIRAKDLKQKLENLKIMHSDTAKDVTKQKETRGQRKPVSGRE